MKKVLKCLLMTVLLFILLVSAWIGCVLLVNYKFYFLLKEGLTEQEVIRMLGNPVVVVQGPKRATDRYYVPGYEYQSYPVKKKVLIYFGFPDLIVYVYIDDEGTVEKIFRGGS